MTTLQWPGCPAGCETGRALRSSHECGVDEPIKHDEHLYDCVAEFVPDQDRGVRLTCARKCKGACSLRDSRTASDAPLARDAA